MLTDCLKFDRAHTSDKSLVLIAVKTELQFKFPNRFSQGKFRDKVAQVIREARRNI